MRTEAYGQQVRGEACLLYAYYHCIKGCRFRSKAEEVHDAAFRQELQRYVPRQEFQGLYRALILEAFHEQTKAQDSERQQLLSHVKELEQRIAHARDPVARAKIEPVDFREIKAGCTATIEKLEAKLNSLA